MTLATILPWIQMAVSISLIALILFQRTEGGLGSAFGGGDGSGTRYTKRGAEKILFVTTIILAILFGVLAVVSRLINS